MTCRTCVHLDVAPRKDGKIVPDSRFTYNCLAVMPDAPALPACARRISWPPTRWRMDPASGKDCAFHVKRPKAALKGDQA